MTNIHVVKQTFVCRVDIPLILKNVTRRKKLYKKSKSKKNPRQIQHPTTDLQMELLVKIVIDFKL